MWLCRGIGLDVKGLALVCARPLELRADAQIATESRVVARGGSVATFQLLFAAVADGLG